MKLIKRLERRIPKGTGKQRQSFGLFLCPYCNKKVERGLSNGKRDKSCGCMYHVLNPVGKSTHGYSRIKLYRVWYSMIDRCHNQKHIDYHNYGERGIVVCREWRSDISFFIKWAISSGYKVGLQIDRRDNDGGYNPLNCRWVTCTVNSRNRRSTKINIKKAREIRIKRIINGTSYKNLGKEYLLDASTIYGIIKNKTWKENKEELLS